MSYGAAIRIENLCHPTRLEHRNGICRTAGASSDLQRQRHEHELVTALFGTRTRERFEQRVVDERDAIAIEYGMSWKRMTARVGHGIVHIPREYRHIAIANEPRT